MADVEVKARLSVDTGDSAQKLDAVKKGLQSTGQGAGAAGGSFNKLKAELGSIQGPAGQVTQSLGLVGQALNVLKAHPIIGIFILIAGLVYALFQRFKQMEGVSDSLGKAWASLSGMFDTFVNYILTPLIDGFVTLVEWATKAAEFVVGIFAPSLAEAGKRSGELAEALDDLEDAESRSALARAESNRKLQEARELAADANVPIRERIAALQEAGRIEKQELENSIKIAQDRARIMTEQIAIELGARQELIDKIRSGNIEALKAARNELFAMQNVNKDKIKEIDALIIKAEDEGATLAKIEKKTQSAITGLQQEENRKRTAAGTAAADKRKAEMKELTDFIAKEQERQRKLQMDGFAIELFELDKKYKQALALARKYGIDAKTVEDLRFQETVDIINKETAADWQRWHLKDENFKAAMPKLATQTSTVVAITKEGNDQLKYSDQEMVAFRQNLYAQLGDTMMAFSELVGKETIAGKALAVGSATINTFLAATKSLAADYSAFGPFALAAKIAATAATIATGLAAVKNIVKTPTGARGGGGSSAMPSVSTALSSPIAPQPMLTSTSINAGSIQALGNAAAGGVGRSYVLDSDINNSAERTARIQRAASLG